MIRGPSVSGQACSEVARPCLVRGRRFANNTSARSIWSQAAEVLADRPEVGAATDAVLREPGGLRLIRICAGAGLDGLLRL